MTNFSDVGDFHDRFGLHRVDLSDDSTVGPQDVTDDLRAFRRTFLLEELREYFEAHGIKLHVTEEWDSVREINHAKAFDALIDLVYVALGTAHLEGYPWEEGWELVQQANMKKIRATRPEQSKRGSTFDVVKPEGWTAPDIEGLLVWYGF